MFCCKCGKQLDDAAKFCESCGAPVEIPIADVTFESKQVDIQSESTLQIEPQMKPITEEKARKALPKWALLIALLCFAVLICLAFLMGFPSNKTEGGNKSIFSSILEDSNDEEKFYENDSERIIGKWVTEVDYASLGKSYEVKPGTNVGLAGKTMGMCEFTKSGKYKFDIDRDSFRERLEETCLMMKASGSMAFEEFEEEKGIEFDELIDQVLEKGMENLEKYGTGDYEIKDGYLYISEPTGTHQYEYEFKGDNILIVYSDGDVPNYYVFERE